MNTTWVVWFDGLVGWVYGCSTKAEALIAANEKHGPENYAVLQMEKGED